MLLTLLIATYGNALPQASRKLLVSTIMQPLLFCIWLINVTTAVLVHEMSKRLVRTYCSLDIYPLKKGSQESDAGVRPRLIRLQKICFQKSKLKIKNR